MHFNATKCSYLDLDLNFDSDKDLDLYYKSYLDLHPMHFNKTKFPKFSFNS